MKKLINILFSTMLVLNLPILSISCIKKPDTTPYKPSGQQSKSKLKQEDIIKDLNTMCNKISHILKSKELMVLVLLLHKAWLILLFNKILLKK